MTVRPIHERYPLTLALLRAWAEADAREQQAALGALLSVLGSQGAPEPERPAAVTPARVVGFRP